MIGFTGFVWTKDLMAGRRTLQCKRFGRCTDRELGPSWERLILSFPVAIMMAAAINLPLGRAQKNKQTNKETPVWSVGERLTKEKR